MQDSTEAQMATRRRGDLGSHAAHSSAPCRELQALLAAQTDLPVACRQAWGCRAAVGALAAAATERDAALRQLITELGSGCGAGGQVGLCGRAAASGLSPSVAWLASASGEMRGAFGSKARRRLTALAAAGQSATRLFLGASSTAVSAAAACSGGRRRTWAQPPRGAVWERTWRVAACRRGGLAGAAASGCCRLTVVQGQAGEGGQAACGPPSVPQLRLAAAQRLAAGLIAADGGR